MGLIDVEWAATQLAVTVSLQNDALHDAVVVVTFRGGLGDALEYASVSTTRARRRIVRLQYDWDAATRIMCCGTIGQAREIMRELATPGNVLRARLREAREPSNDKEREASFHRRQTVDFVARYRSGVGGHPSPVAGETRTVGDRPTQAVFAFDSNSH